MTKYINAKFVCFADNPRDQYLLLAAITLLAGALRFHKLGEWSFWRDELITISHAQNIASGNFIAS